jgi:MFS transporter, DHA2 family, multidrug resistance protein
VAILTTFIDHRQSQHAQILARHISAFDPHTVNFAQQVQAYIHSRGFDIPQSGLMSVKILQLIVDQQGLILAFEDVYKLVGILFICALPLLFVLGSGAKGRAAAAAAGH